MREHLLGDVLDEGFHRSRIVNVQCHADGVFSGVIEDVRANPGNLIPFVLHGSQLAVPAAAGTAVGTFATGSTVYGLFTDEGSAVMAVQALVRAGATGALTATLGREEYGRRRFA